MSEVIVSVLGLAFLFIVQLLAIAYLYGRLTEKVTGQGDRINRLETQGNERFGKLHESVHELRDNINTQLGQIRQQLFDLQVRKAE